MTNTQFGCSVSNSGFLTSPPTSGGWENSWDVVTRSLLSPCVLTPHRRALVRTGWQCSRGQALSMSSPWSRVTAIRMWNWNLKAEGPLRNMRSWIIFSWRTFTPGLLKLAGYSDPDLELLLALQTEKTLWKSAAPGLEAHLSGPAESSLSEAGCFPWKSHVLWKHGVSLWVSNFTKVMI